jgi:pyruvate ferredoxin oxidoreductase gamma subunit
MKEIRIHGRGGQGVVTAAELIARAAFYDKKQSQAFPNFGVERSGAPIQSYARISSKRIITREQIKNPDILIIQDDSLTNNKSIFAGCNKDTIIIINSSQPKNLNQKFLARYKTYYINATKIALEIIGKNIVNTVILGSFAKQTKLVSLESLKKAITDKFKEKGKDIINKNIKAVSKLCKKYGVQLYFDAARYAENCYFIKVREEAYKDVDFGYTDPVTGKSLEFQVFEHANLNGINSFQAAFRDFYHDQLMASAQTSAKENTAKAIQERNKSGFLGNVSAAKPSTPSHKNMNYDELLEAAAKDTDIFKLE